MLNMKSAVCSVLIFAVFFTAVSLASDTKYTQEIQKWRQERLKRLKADDGWPTLAGLYWLKEGENRVGSSESLPVVLPSSAPKLAGTLNMSGGKVQFTPQAGVTITNNGKPVAQPVELVSDADPKTDPTVLRIGSISFFVIKRGDKIGVRVRDNNSPARKNLSSLAYFPIDPTWRLEATFDPYKPAKKIPIVNILGMVEDTDSAGALVFQIKGTTYRLDVLEEENDGVKEFFIIFGDGTNKDQTYASGRYIYTSEPDKNGKVVLDFNKAYSPPCAFTHFATCPLPPKQNKLPILITAGEKRPPGNHS